ncbi:unnamed protein product [Chironomus riparius]|uniref:Uncharacterized protein n=1 Tax=Chironomus riparius TaxID=315576 RepID=A0A9N9S5R4_9DIPT|nr:unnamed protein product [Chironomus riparius]
MEGWNDPMDLSKFEATGKLKINLNKRVAFPLSGGPISQTSSSSQEPLQLLPTIPFGLGENNNNNSDKSDLQETSEFNSETSKEKVCSILHQSIDQLDSSIQNNVKAKLKSLEAEWSKCDIDLQKLLVQLVDYIEQKDAKNAGGIQRKIIITGYKPWMQGVRHIIFSLESQDSKTNDIANA